MLGNMKWLIGVVGMGLLVVGCARGPHVPPGPLYPVDRAEYWAAMGRCEQPGDGWAGVRWDHPGPNYQGGLGFYNRTWDHWKLDGYADNAGDATPEEQMIVADRVYDDVGAGAWGCSRRVGLRP